ncbi:MAG: hypothetical protein JWR20_1895 [Marmoricola sp.]|nr:hypothetical protein [Marmoricola sp.]
MVRAWWTLVVLTSAGLVLLTAVRFVPGRSGAVVAAASFSSYAVVGYAALLLALAVAWAWRRSRRSGDGAADAQREVGGPRALRGALVAVAVAGLVVHVLVLTPLFTSSSAAGAHGSPTAGPTVLTANLEFGQGDPAAVVRAVRRFGVDVAVLEEVTPSSLQRLRAAGLERLLPHRAGRASPGADGTVVLARWRVRTVRSLDLGNGGYEVRVAGPHSFTLLAAHTTAPVASSARWGGDLGRLSAAAAELTGPVVLAGDLNATRDHQPFRRLLDTGLRDAGEEAGSGWQSTWPSRWLRPWLRPLLALDHVLVSSALRGVRTRTVEVPDSDHVGLVADLAWADGA